MNPILPTLPTLPSFPIEKALPYITPHLFLYVFYLIVAVVIFISLFLFWHWKEYAEDIIQGVAIYALYGCGVAALLLTIYSQIQALI